MARGLFFKVGYLNKEYAQELYDMGYCDQQIADKCGVSYETVRKWRKNMGLVGHRTPYIEKEEKKPKTTLVEMAAEARARGMTYGEYMVARREGNV